MKYKTEKISLADMPVTNLIVGVCYYFIQSKIQSGYYLGFRDNYCYFVDGSKTNHIYASDGVIAVTDDYDAAKKVYVNSLQRRIEIYSK